MAPQLPNKPQQQQNPQVPTPSATVPVNPPSSMPPLGTSPDPNSTNTGFLGMFFGARSSHNVPPK